MKLIHFLREREKKRWTARLKCSKRLNPLLDGYTFHFPIGRRFRDNSGGENVETSSRAGRWMLEAESWGPRAGTRRNMSINTKRSCFKMNLLLWWNAAVCCCLTSRPQGPIPFRVDSIIILCRLYNQVQSLPPTSALSVGSIQVEDRVDFQVNLGLGALYWPGLEFNPSGERNNSDVIRRP